MCFSDSGLISSPSFGDVSDSGTLWSSLREPLLGFSACRGCWLGAFPAGSTFSSPIVGSASSSDDTVGFLLVFWRLGCSGLPVWPSSLPSSLDVESKSSSSGMLDTLSLWLRLGSNDWMLGFWPAGSCGSLSSPGSIASDSSSWDSSGRPSSRTSSPGFRFSLIPGFSARSPFPGSLVGFWVFLDLGRSSSATGGDCIFSRASASWDLSFKRCNLDMSLSFLWCLSAGIPSFSTSCLPVSGSFFKFSSLKAGFSPPLGSESSSLEPELVNSVSRCGFRELSCRFFGFLRFSFRLSSTFGDFVFSTVLFAGPLSPLNCRVPSSESVSFPASGWLWVTSRWTVGASSPGCNIERIPASRDLSFKRSILDSIPPLLSGLWPAPFGKELLAGSSESCTDCTFGVVFSSLPLFDACCEFSWGFPGSDKSFSSDWGSEMGAWA